MSALGIDSNAILYVRDRAHSQQSQPRHPQQQRTNGPTPTPIPIPTPTPLPTQGGGGGGAPLITPQFFQQMMQNALQAQQTQPPQPQRQTEEEDPEVLRSAILSDPELMAQLMVGNPPLHQAVLSGDLEVFKSVLREQKKAREEEKRRQRELQNRIALDPLNPEHQRLIQEQINQENIEMNMNNAIEHNPESFARVVMLFIDCHVNRVPIKAFVDSGAQQTIMSLACADRCHITHLIDRRFSGIAKGVGTARIIGRVHLADLNIGNSFFPTSFTIMEDQDLDLLLGLDMLRRHQCTIDLRENVLRIGPENVPFLSEKDIPHHFRLEAADPSTHHPATSHPSTTSSSSSSPSDTPKPIPNPMPNPTPPRDQNEEIIQNLMNVTGRPRDAVVRALQNCGGNAELAASQLFFG